MKIDKEDWPAFTTLVGLLCCEGNETLVLVYILYNVYEDCKLSDQPSPPGLVCCVVCVRRMRHCITSCSDSSRWALREGIKASKPHHRSAFKRPSVLLRWYWRFCEALQESWEAEIDTGDLSFYHWWPLSYYCYYYLPPIDHFDINTYQHCKLININKSLLTFGPFSNTKNHTNP